MNRPAKLGLHFLDDDFNILQGWKGVFDFMCDPVSHCLNELAGVFHDLTADPVDHLVVDGVVEIIRYSGFIHIHLYAHIDDIVISPFLFVNVIAVMRVE